MNQVPIEEKYQTPHDIASYMCGLVPAGVQRVLEPTKGACHIVQALVGLGYEVVAPDDYFELDPGERYDCVVMNPPFSSDSAKLDRAPESFPREGMKVGYEFLLQCMRKSDHVIALMPWFTISDSDVRLRHLKAYGLRSVTLLPRRTFDYARIQTCVFELDRGFKGATEFKVYDLLQQPKLEL